MSFHRQWLRKLFSRLLPKSVSRKTPLPKLCLEPLENRITPTNISWTGNAGTLNWGTANNWSSDTVPGSADDVTINLTGVGTINIGTGSYAVDSLNDTTASLDSHRGVIDLSKPITILSLSKGFLG